MVQLLPLRGIRYAPDFAQSSVMAPPYDVISPAQHATLLAQDAHNVVRLILGAGPEDTSWYGAAAGTLAEWRERGVLIRDVAPSLYGYRQTFSIHGRTLVRTGFLARIRLEEWGQGIHRHERTRLGPKADRLALMKATHMNMSPVFGLYRDPSGDIARSLGSGQVLFDGQDTQDVRHLLWQVADPAVLGAVTRAFAERDVVIADGHHRYETALAYRDFCRQRDGQPSEPQPYDHVLIYLTAISDPGLCVLATHRVIAGPAQVDESQLLAALSRDFSVERAAPGVPLSQAIAGHPSVCIGLYLGSGRAWTLTLRQPGSVGAGADSDSGMAQLDVNVLQRAVLTHFGLEVEAMASTDRVTYTIDEAEAIAAVDAGRAVATCILNPTTLDQIWTASLQGIPMPQKSTYFHPKLLTGLVLNTLENE